MDENELQLRKGGVIMDSLGPDFIASAQVMRLLSRAMSDYEGGWETPSVIRISIKDCVERQVKDVETHSAIAQLKNGWDGWAWDDYEGYFETSKACCYYRRVESGVYEVVRTEAILKDLATLSKDSNAWKARAVDICRDLRIYGYTDDVLRAFGLVVS